jgi:hypothetical protein
VLQIVKRATAVDRDERFATALEMQTAIEQALAQKGWFVGPRDLADFMSEHFGESRRAEQVRLQQALRETASFDAMMNCSVITPWANVLPIEPTRQPLLTDAQTASARFRSRTRWAVLAASLVCLGFAGAWTLRRPAASPAVETEEPSPKTISLEIDARPLGAELFLDGTLVGRDHFAAQRSVSDKRLTLEVRAPGYLSERRTLSLRNDTTLQIALAQDPAAATPAAAASVSAGDAKLQASPVLAGRPARSRSVAGRHASPRDTPSTAAPKPAPLARRSAKCNPPFVYSADGVKTYKPECF